MTTELRQQCLTDGEIPVHLGRPPTALLLGAVGLDHELGGLGDLLLGAVSVHLAAGVVSLLLIVLGGDKDLTLPLKFFFFVVFPLQPGQRHLPRGVLVRAGWMQVMW